MKPTEADIQAELIEGWGLLTVVNHEEAESSFAIVSDGKTKITIFNSYYANMFFKKCGRDEDSVCIDHTDFLTGNYDLSAISQHYDPEEWQRIITMCESIVRLITGEKVEQTLEEKVREILEPLSAIADIEVEPDVVIFTAGFSKREIVSTGVIDHDAMSDSCRHEDFDIYDKEYAEAYRKVAALLTEQPEQTLEEAVRGAIKKFGIVKHLESHHVLGSMVVFETGIRTEIITKDEMAVWYHDHDGWSSEMIDSLLTGGDGESANYNKFIQHIAALLSTRSTKPSYSDLEQRVEELEKYIASDYCKENCELREEIDSLNESYEQIAETKTRVLDALEATQTELKEKKSRITDLEAQLQDYISPADHEAEMANCDSLLAKVTLERDQARKDSALHLSWFHREYAKNAEASQ